VWNPIIKWTDKYAVFVLLEDDLGHVGLGECWCFDACPDALVAYLRTEVAPHILGLAVKDQQTVFDQLLARSCLTARHGILRSALSGVDIALWDLRSQGAKLPLWKYLRTQGLHSNMPDGCVYLYGSGGLYGENKTTDDLVSELKAIQNQAYDLVKMKVGAMSIEEDIDRVNAVLNGLDSETQLIIDGVYSYTPEQAQQLFKALPRDRLAAFQSPVPAHNISAMAHLIKAGIPVMANEAEYRQELHNALIEQPAVKYLQTAPIASGGISRLIELSRAVETGALLMSLEVSSTAVALMAACHFAAACESVAHTEYHFVHQVFFDELDLRPIRGNAGWYQLPDRSGLGVTLPQAEVALAFDLKG